MDCGVPFHIESYQNKLRNDQSGRSIDVQGVKQARDGCYLLLVDEGYIAADEGWSLSALNQGQASPKRKVINIEFLHRREYGVARAGLFALEKS